MILEERYTVITSLMSLLSPDIPLFFFFFLNLLHNVTYFVDFILFCLVTSVSFPVSSHSFVFLSTLPCNMPVAIRADY